MNTKLVLVILQGGSCDKLLNQLIDANYRVTEISSMGGFLRSKSLTLMIGVYPDQVEHVLDMIRTACPSPAGASQHNATVFVLDAGESIAI
jgi:uncharacterized protein YaaQ